MLDTNDSAALDKAAAILANDDFLEAATMSLSGAGGREYGAPSVLFSPAAAKLLRASAYTPELLQRLPCPNAATVAGQPSSQLSLSQLSPLQRTPAKPPPPTVAPQRARARGPCARRRARRAAQKIPGRAPAASRRPPCREDFLVVLTEAARRRTRERDRPTCERRARGARAAGTGGRRAVAAGTRRGAARGVSRGVSCGAGRARRPAECRCAQRSRRPRVQQKCTSTAARCEWATSFATQRASLKCR